VTAPCEHDRCITCSDEAVAVTVLRTYDDGLAEVVTEPGHTEHISIALVDAKAGDRVVVHAGEALQVLGDDELTSIEAP
jgi:hydrogenase expression/formation protein HypC